MKTLTTFCGYHPLEMVMHPLGLFPAEKRDDPMWCNRVSHVKDVWAMHPNQVGRITVQCMSALYRLQALQSDAMGHLTNLAHTTKLTLDSREDFVVDLSSELVEKDLQVEQLSQRIATLEQQVEIRDNTIDIVENQLTTTWRCTTRIWRRTRPKARRGGSRGVRTSPWYQCDSLRDAPCTLIHCRLYHSGLIG
jgi:hypothetical protein